MRINKEKLATFSAVVGTTLGIGSCAVDVVTCPGEVNKPSSDAPVIVCDEHPEHDNIANNPGTLEQKIMYGGFGLAAVSIGAIALFRKPDELVGDEGFEPPTPSV